MPSHSVIVSYVDSSEGRLSRDNDLLRSLRGLLVSFDFSSSGLLAKLKTLADFSKSSVPAGKTSNPAFTVLV